ncbi:TPA: hypothetical protein ACFP3W_001085 [Neisseria subflava]
MHHSKKLFKLSTLALCLAALPQAAQAAEEVQQAAAWTPKSPAA